MNEFTKDWDDWLNHNISMGNCKEVMFKKSLDAGYDYDLIKNKLNFEYNKNTFAPDWEKWLNNNITNGNCKTILFEKSLEHGYDYNLIKNKLNIDYPIKKTHDTITLRTAKRVPCKNMELYEIHNFLNKEECQHIIEIINSSKLEQSKTISSKNIGEKTNDERTSKTCYFENNDYIPKIESRICKTIGINPQKGEGIQGQKYTKGQEFKLHADYFDSTVIADSPDNQRSWTFMIYLNDMEDDLSGGYTSFPYSYIATKPECGKAVIWNNLNNDDSVNQNTRHCGMPILKGEKYILTKWFTKKEKNLSLKNDLVENIHFPIFHHIGFEKRHLELECIQKIKKWMKEHESGFKIENCINGSESKMNSKILDMQNIPKHLLDETVATFKTLLTHWIGYKSNLHFVNVYGIREYSNGGSLDNHYDRKHTHIISAIIHIEDDCDEKWELYIEDHHFRPHYLTMNYGDVIFYESTTCLHGRPNPLKGSMHRNMYIHFKVDNWENNI